VRLDPGSVLEKAATPAIHKLDSASDAVVGERVHGRVPLKVSETPSENLGQNRAENTSGVALSFAPGQPLPPGAAASVPSFELAALSQTPPTELISLLGLNPLATPHLMPLAEVLTVSPDVLLGSGRSSSWAEAAPAGAASAPPTAPLQLEAEDAVRVGGLALSVGVVVWVLRAGGLVASMMVSLPVWRQLDPMPIVDREATGRRRGKLGGDPHADGGAMADKQSKQPEDSATTVHRNPNLKPARATADALLELH
jgi:hypothetical protein